MRLLGIVLVGLLVLALVFGLLNLLAGETGVPPRGSELLERPTEEDERLVVPSRRQFEAPRENPPGPFYIQ